MNLESKDYAHLHVHTEYSTLDGINRIDTLAKHVKDQGQTACAITDHGNMSGTYKFWKAAQKIGIKPIIGIEAYYSVIDRTVKDKDEDENNYYHLILLAKNRKGLENLFALTTKSYTEGFYHKPRMDDALLAEYGSDIIATSACLGSRTSQLILNNRKQEAEKLLRHHAEMFKDNFFLEVQLHEESEQQHVNAELIEISKRTGLPLVLTSDCHYTQQEDKEIHEQALCIQTNSTMSSDKRFSFGDIDVHVATTELMIERAKRQNIPLEAIKNTSLIAQSIDDLSYFTNIVNRYPSFQSLPDGVSSWEALERLVKHHLTEKMNGNVPDEYKKRVNEELVAIKRMGFSDYMLIVWEYINGARDAGVMVGPGRGSAAGSLVAYALGITQLDPIKYRLLFSRFLNEGRGAIPEIFTREMKERIDSLPPPQHEDSHHHHHGKH